jgi:hypothetical protein
MKTGISLVLLTIAMHTEFFWVIGVCVGLVGLIHWKELYLFINQTDRKS